MTYLIGHMENGKFVQGPPAAQFPRPVQRFIELPAYQHGEHPDPLSDVIAWTHKNPLAWSSIVHWAHEDIANDSRPCVDLYCHLLRRPWFANKLRLQRSDTIFLVNNNLTSGLARLLNREYPELKVPTREAKVDSWS